MKMNFFFGNVFWGILLVMLGTSLILKSFNINLPLVKIFLAVIIIMFGVKLLIGTSNKSVKSERFRSRSFLRTNKSGEYNMIFSSGKIDLSDLKEDSLDLEVTVVFGYAAVILPRHLKFDFEPTTVFGATLLPDRRQYASGDEQSREIKIESNCIFGRIDYFYQDINAPEIIEPLDPEESSTEQSSDF